MFEITLDAESIEVIEVIELDKLVEGVDVGELWEVVALDTDAVVGVLAGIEDGAAVLAGGLPVHEITVTIEALRTSVNVE